MALLPIPVAHAAGWVGLFRALALACGRTVPGVKPTIEAVADGHVGSRVSQLQHKSLAILGDDMEDEVLEAILAAPSRSRHSPCPIGCSSTRRRSARSAPAR